jgi:hypothetical protein
MRACGRCICRQFPERTMLNDESSSRFRLGCQIDDENCKLIVASGYVWWLCLVAIRFAVTACLQFHA